MHIPPLVVPVHILVTTEEVKEKSPEEEMIMVSGSRLQRGKFGGGGIQNMGIIHERLTRGIICRGEYI